MMILSGPRAGKSLRRQIRDFRREESGSMIVFTLYIMVCMMLAIGLSIDTVRYEYTRTKLQHTLDRAILAAANLEQSLDPETVVEDYFEKAGLIENLISVNVEQGINYRTVSATSKAEVETMFIDMVGIEKLSVPASGEANESLADIEIALVLDNSGSMRTTASNGKTRLQLLQAAAKEFVGAVAREEGEDGTTAISVIPFSEQVTVGETLLDQYNISNEHNTTHCVVFEDAHFRSASLTPTQELKRMAYFDPRTPSSTDWSTNDPDICDKTDNRAIVPWSTNATYLQGRIDNMVAKGWTSIDIGAKWGVTMLDPGSQPVLTGMIGAGKVDSSLAGQPFAYHRDNTMKILVVMSDGANTYQRAVEDTYRSGDSPLYVYNGKYSWRWDSGSETHYYNRYSSSERYWESSPIGGSNATRLTWAEVWADMPIYTYAKEFESRARHSGSTSYRWTYYNKILREIGSTSSSTPWSGNEKNFHTSDICAAAKDKGVLVFTIGMDTDATAADMTLEDCASLPTYYYDVESLDISNAFASIAVQINQLRLTQ